MARGVRVSIFDEKTRAWSEQTFSAEFPIRIGRSSLNDLRLASSAVSQFHAVLEVQDGVLTIRDLGSRNGTLQSGTRLAPNATAVLPEARNEIIIVRFLLVVTLMELADEPKLMGTPSLGVPELPTGRTTAEGVPRFGYTLRMDRPAVDALVANYVTNAGTEAPSDPGPRPPSVYPEPDTKVNNPSWMKERIEPLYLDFLAARDKLRAAVRGSVGALEDDLRKPVGEQLALAFPELAHDADFQRLVEPIPVSEGSILSNGGASQQGSPAALATIATQAVRLLAASFFPEGKVPETPADVAVFMQRVKETLEVFFKCFIPLHEGFRAFTSELDIPPPARADHTGHGRVRSVETVASPKELAELLLDWTPRQPERVDPKQAIEWVFADLMIHHMAMLTGVMQGVKSLLGELSPAAIERALDDPRRGSAGLQIGPFRYKQLWELFATRHADLAEEDKEAFALIFGPDFARAYAGLAADTVAVRGAEHLTRSSWRPPPKG